MGRIIQKNNGKTTVFVTGEDLSNIVPGSGEYYLGPDLNSGDYIIASEDGVFNLETNYMTGGTYDNNTGTLNISGPNYSIDINGFPTGGTGTFEVVDVTYTELYNSIVDGLLIPGSWYRLTDYRSVNFLNGAESANVYFANPTPPFDPSYNAMEVYTGDTEVLLLQAITNYDLSPTAYSEKYPQDIITFEAFTNKLGVYYEAFNGSTLPDSSVVSGLDLQWDSVNNYVYFNMPTNYPAYFGNILYIYAEFNDGVNSYYQDGTFEPLVPNISRAQYDYSSDYGDILKPMSRVSVVDNGTKIILLDLVQADVTNYIADSLYINFVVGINDATGYVINRVDTAKNIKAPIDFRNVKYRRFEVDFSNYSDYMGTNYYLFKDTYNFGGYAGVISTTGNYKDVSMFYQGDSSDVTINCNGGPYAYWYRGYFDNTIIETAYNASLDGYFFNNHFININNSKYNGSYYQNIFFSNSFSKINGYCSSILADYLDRFDINSNLYSVVFRGYSTNTTINSSYIQNSWFAPGFSDNKINCNNFNSVTTKTGFKRNNITCSLFLVDFTPATVVYGDYDKNMFTNINFEPRISYIDAFDTLTIQNILV